MLELAAHTQLVMFGSRDRSGFSALLLGSVTHLAERVVVGVADEPFGAGLL